MSIPKSSSDLKALQQALRSGAFGPPIDGNPQGARVHAFIAEAEAAMAGDARPSSLRQSEAALASTGQATSSGTRSADIADGAPENAPENLQPPHEPRFDLWESLRALIESFFSVCGAPGEVWLAREGRIFFSAAERADLVAWLKPLEELARLLLAQMASSLGACALKLRPRLKQKRAAAPCALGANAFTWPAHFRALEPAIAKPDQESKRRALRVFNKDAPKLFAARPILLRMEALRRVAIAPLAFARRLALRIGRDARISTRLRAFAAHMLQRRAAAGDTLCAGFLGDAARGLLGEFNTS